MNAAKAGKRRYTRLKGVFDVSCQRDFSYFILIDVIVHLPPLSLCKTATYNCTQFGGVISAVFPGNLSHFAEQTGLRRAKMTPFWPTLGPF
jgi:hypothetical protein